MNTVVHPFGNLPLVQSSGGVEFNWFCSVKDGVHQNAFDNHRICEGSIICQWILVAMFTTGIILVFFEWLESNVRATVLSVSSSIPVFCIILYAFGMSQQRRGRQMPFNISIRYVGNIIIFTRAVTMGARVINLARNGPCDDNATRYNMDCNPQHDQQLLPILPVLQLYATSLIVPIIYRCHTAWINFLCVFIVFGVMCVALTYANASEVMFHASGSLMIASLVGMYDFEHSVAHAFTAYSNLEKVTREKVIAENEKQIIEDNAKDLRHFIGNVAHDLKTPLQAFVSELDYLDESLGNDSRAGLHSVRSLKSTCHYMTMTINRWHTFCSTHCKMF